MTIRQTELRINLSEPFSNCKLGRQKYAQVLTGIINSYQDGFVMAINNKWGTGKTTFVKMWEQELKNKAYTTVYFNAWENDFEDNPLTALIAELKTITKQPTEPEFKTLLKRAAILSKHIAPAVAKAIVEKYISTESLKGAIEGVTTGLTEIFENEVDEYAKKKKSISEFRDSLSEFVGKTIKDKPLIFIIDELDRCRPNYAVSILEQIKHFFSVKKIIFILSIDKIQLGNAVRGVYGSDRIDADEYLRRFIDIEYSIPEPEAEVFYKYLYEVLDFDSFFQSVERLNFDELRSDKDNFLHVCKVLFTRTFIPLRQQERIFAISRLALRSFPQNNYVIPQIFLFLSYLKICHFSFYEKLKNKKLTIKQVQAEFISIVNTMKDDSTTHDLMWLEAYLLNYYNNYYYKGSITHNKLLVFDNESGQNELRIDSIVDEAEHRLFLEIFESFNQGFSRSGNLSLEHFLNKLELLDNIT